MIVNKVTDGFVIQRFDTEKKIFIDQEFIAGSSSEYEDSNGNSVDFDLLVVDNQEVYLPYDMVQPKQDATDEDFQDWLEGEAGEFGKKGNPT